MNDGEHERDETDGTVDLDGGAPPVRQAMPTPPRPFDAEPQPEAAETAVTDDVTAEAESAVEVIAEHAPPAESAPLEDLSELPLLLESLLFVADHPVEESYLARALEVSSTRIERALDELGETLREGRRGTRLQRGPEGVALVTAPEAAARIEHFLGLEASRRLSTAALETLAIIAYRQPITRGQIDTVRGVSSDGAVATLRARALIAPAGYAPGPGRPMLFQTTQRFLEHFGLERAGQLPALPDDIDLPPAEISEQLGLDEQEVANALAAAPQEVAETIETAEIDPAVAEIDPAVAEIDPAVAVIDSAAVVIDPAVADDARVEITTDLHALTEAAEAILTHAADFQEASNEDGSDARARSAE